MGENQSGGQIRVTVVSKRAKRSQHKYHRKYNIRYISSDDLKPDDALYPFHKLKQLEFKYL